MSRKLPLLSLFFLQVFLLAACASEKNPTDFSKTGQDSDSGAACSKSYAPIPVLRDGLTNIPNPDSLPRGSYTYVGGEVYVREEETNGFQAHFIEEFRDIGISTRKICSTTLAANRLLDIGFPTVREIFRSAGDVFTHRPSVQSILGEGKNIRLSRGPQQDLVNGGISPILAGYMQWRIYQSTATSFEIRGSGGDVNDGSFFTKRIVMRFSYAP